MHPPPQDQDHSAEEICCQMVWPPLLPWGQSHSHSCFPYLLIVSFLFYINFYYLWVLSRINTLSCYFAHYSLYLTTCDRKNKIYIHTYISSSSSKYRIFNECAKRKVPNKWLLLSLYVKVVGTTRMDSNKQNLAKRKKFLIWLLARLIDCLIWFG